MDVLKRMTGKVALKLALICVLFGAAVGSIVFRLWLAVGGDVLVILLLSPDVIEALSRKSHARLAEVRRAIPWPRLSRAQQMAIAIGLFMIPYGIWRTLSDGPVALAYAGPFVVLGLVWLVVVLRREGWSGKR
jgi:hypothetical protein